MGERKRGVKDGFGVLASAPSGWTELYGEDLRAGRVGAQFWVWPYGSPDGVVLWVSGCAICSQGGAAAPELAVMCQERSELFFNLPVTPA